MKHESPTPWLVVLIVLLAAVAVSVLSGCAGSAFEVAASYDGQPEVVARYRVEVP